jgi:alpha-amylase
MTSLVFYFQVHQPHRLRRYSFFDIGGPSGYFDEDENRRILRRVAEKSYLPMNALLLEQIERHEGRFRVSFSISSTALDQVEAWSPETLESFRRLLDTDCVELLGETSHHSLAFLGDPTEFEEQIRLHRARLEALFGVTPRVFRNTELICDQNLARTAERLGFRGILCEGAEHLLGWRSPHRVYRPEGCERLKMLMRSYRFSDDIAFRFSNRAWEEYPLTAPKFARWVHALPPEETVVGLFMDYETFGEHQWEETGIFDFMAHLPAAIGKDARFRFETPSEVLEREPPVARLPVPRPVSWADQERDLTAWLGNAMQRDAHQALYALARPARAAGRAGHSELLETWRRLTTSDHFYYMCVKWFSDGDVHKYFSPYPSPHDAFITFMNVVDDLRRRLERAAKREFTIAR